MKTLKWCLLAAALVLHLSNASPQDNKDAFDWDKVAPRENLVYHDCYDKFKCARLQVPLDWLNESDARRATIAVIKLPAVVSDDDKTFGGPILTNPGGPGGSGIDHVLGSGRYIQRLAELPGKRNYEIVSFDPRGVGYTLPSSDCFGLDKIGRATAAFETRGVGRLDGGGNTIPYRLSLTEGFARRCLATEEENGEGMAFVNTPSVARDMIAIIDKIDEEKKHSREEQDEGRIELKRRHSYEKPDKDAPVPRLQYVGFSYGTILGNYFASLFPGRVGRMVLDGVDDADDYATGPGWTTNLVDTDEIFDSFFKGCFAAGRSACPLVKSDDTSADDVKARVWDWIIGLDSKPVPATTATGSILAISTIDVLSVIGRACYGPYGTFRDLANTLDQSMQGNVTGIIDGLKERELPPLEDACAVNGTSSPQRPEAQSAILCSDGDDISGKDAAWWEDYVTKQTKSSKVFGAYWSNIRLSCASWPFQPNWEFKGPFSTPPAAVKSGKAAFDRPSAPLLFLTNTLDPVTPLSAARRMAANHPGSRLVIHEASGHCALGAPTTKPCIKDILAEYFYSGKVPDEKETRCDGACDPWDTDCGLFRAEAAGVPQPPMGGLRKKQSNMPLGL